MIDFVITLIGVLLYSAATIVLFRQLSTQPSKRNRRLPLFLGLAAVMFHADILARYIFIDTGLQMGFTHVASLATWFVASLLILASLNKPVENLGLLVLPLAAFTLAVEYFIPIDHVINTTNQQGLGVHIMLSILAYSLLGLAAVQALLLSIQERNLHNRKPGGFIRTLPPMETMEDLLVQMITIGFALQSMSLLSGIIHLDDMFAQHLAHKTILSIIAWFVFAILLWGRWRFGWRGRTVIRWTLSGFATLVVAYFGSKYVIEIILQR